MSQKRNKSGKSQDSTLPPQLDENYILNLIRMPNEELKQRNLLKKAELEAINQQNEEDLDKLVELAKEKLRLKMILLQEKRENEFIAEDLNHCNEKLLLLQTQYNDIVDPFNEVKDFGAKNKEVYYSIAKQFNDRNKNLGEYSEELRNKVSQVEEEINEARAVAAQNQEILNSTNDVLAKKTEELVKVREQRELNESQLKEFDVEALKKKIETVKNMIELKQNFIKDICDDKEKVHSEIQMLTLKKSEALEELKAKQINFSELTANQEILQQRVENDKKIVVQMVQTKLTRKTERVEKANFNIATSLRQMLERQAELEKLAEKLARDKEQKGLLVLRLQNVKAEKLKQNQEIAVKVTDLSTHCSKLNEKKMFVTQKIEEVKAKSLVVQQEIKDNIHDFELKFQKEIRRQTLAGSFNDDKTSEKTSDEAESVALSKMSSSINDIGPIEKVTLGTSMETSIENVPVKKSAKKEKN